MKDFLVGRHEDRLNILSAITANAISGGFAGSMPNTLSRRWITFNVGAKGYKITINGITNIAIGERHGPHTVARTSHIAL